MRSTTVLCFVTAFIITTVTMVRAEVRISSTPTSGMVFIAGTWEPTAPVANLNINDLLVTLAGGNVTVVDFTPTTCVGPMIVDDPIIYSLASQLTLSSCVNLLIYDVVENQGSGGIFLSATGSIPGTGNVVIGTGLGLIPAATNGQYGIPAAPFPTTSIPVHVGSLSGPLNVSAPFLIAVVGDTSAGTSAQLGLPLPLASGAISAFSGQSFAVASGSGTGSYARIGHGNPLLGAPVFGQIDLINENGNLYIQSFPNQPGTRAAIGHTNQVNDITGVINILIEGSPGFGNIWMQGGPAHHAMIGHESLGNGLQNISGNVLVQARGGLTMNAGSCADCNASIGHQSDTEFPLMGTILVETGTGIALNGGSSDAPARIGHEATFIGPGPPDASITVATMGDVLIGGGTAGIAQVGHKSLAGPEQLFGEISMYVHGDLGVIGGGAAALIGHVGGPTAVGAGHIQCFVGGSTSLVAGANATATATMGHQTTFNSGFIKSVSGHTFNCISSSAIAQVTAEEDVSVATGDSLLIMAASTAAGIRSNVQSTTLKAGDAIIQTGLGFIEAGTSVIMHAGEDITLSESFFPQNGVQLQLLELDADRNYLAGDLWLAPGYMSFFLPNLFDLTPLIMQNTPMPDDGEGAFVPSSGLFMPTCTDLIIQSSHRYAETGLLSSLEIGNGLPLDPTFVTGYIEIGSRLVPPDTITALRQSFFDIDIHDTVFGADSLFIKSCHDLNLLNAAINMNGPITLVADAKYPVASTFGSGAFTADNVQLTTSPVDIIRIYSATQNQNQMAGGIVNTTFNGLNYVQCTSSCTYESWSTYYDGGAKPPAGTYMMYYKDSQVLSIQALSIDAECGSGNWELGWQLSASPGTYELDYQVQSDFKTWTTVHTEQVEYPTGVSSIYGNVNLRPSFGQLIRLKATDSDGLTHFSPVQVIRCDQKMVLKVFPNPADHQIKIETGEPGMVRVFDGLGKVIQTQQAEHVHSIDVRDWPGGVYIVQHETLKGGVETQKIVVRH